jgi:hypothetical protein
MNINRIFHIDFIETIILASSRNSEKSRQKSLIMSEIGSLAMISSLGMMVLEARRAILCSNQFLVSHFRRGCCCKQIHHTTTMERQPEDDVCRGVFAV